MKTDRIMWGIILLFIGGVLLLENFNIIDFYWSSIWRFWPVFLIIAGLNILFNKNKSQMGGAISLGVLIIALGVLFYRGIQPRHNENKWLDKSFEPNIDMDFDDDQGHDRGKESRFSAPLPDVVAKRTVLNISGGGTSFELKGETDSLFTASTHRSRTGYSLVNETVDSVNTLTFKMKGKSSWSVNEGGNDVDFLMNKNPEWEIHMNMGAGEVKFDLSEYKVRSFNFDGGAAALDIRIGDLLPIADVTVKTGVADVKLNVPEGVGCRITTKTGLSAKDFNGFTKLKEGLYESPNYASSTKKVFIKLDGGLSNFEVHRY